MDEKELLHRTRQFALRTLALIDAMPNTRAARIVADQLGRSGTSVGANYRAACRGRSEAEFLAKLGVVEEEADESEYWLGLIVDTELLPASRVESLRREAGEITAIMAASRRTMKRRLHRKSQVANRKSQIHGP